MILSPFDISQLPRKLLIVKRERQREGKGKETISVTPENTSLFVKRSP